jgi:hypothetical protein
MTPEYPFGGWSHRGNDRVVPLPRDQAIIRAFYPASDAGNDLFVGAWHRRDTSLSGDTLPVTADPVSGGDNMQYPLNITNSNRSPDTDDRTVFPGDVVEISLCAGNFGTSTTGTYQLEFVLSTNDELTPYDLFSPTVRNRSYAAAEMDCRQETFVVPTGVARNTWYYVGAWMNRGSDYSLTTDNGTVLQRRLYVGHFP